MVIGLKDVDAKDVHRHIRRGLGSLLFTADSRWYVVKSKDALTVVSEDDVRSSIVDYHGRRRTLWEIINNGLSSDSKKEKQIGPKKSSSDKKEHPAIRGETTCRMERATGSRG